jgi:hypothetical protein
MVQLIILALSSVCLCIGLVRLSSPPKQLEGDDLAKHKKEAIKLVVVSVVALAIGAGISFL